MVSFWQLDHNIVKKTHLLSIRYSTIEAKEAAQKPETETHYIQYVFCFNSNISNLHNNDFKIDIIKNVVGTVLFVKVFTTVVKFLSSFINRTSKTSACNIGL
jgi:hypothetical protein